MSYKIQDDEQLGESIRRIVCEQIESAIAASRAERNGESSPVHETRKHLKKARAALRLIRWPSDSVYKCEDRRLRNVGRLISNIRDAEVRLSTVRQLRAVHDGKRARTLEQTEELLAFELDNFLAAFSDWQEEAAQKLKRTQEKIAHWDVSGVTHRHVCQSLRDSYRDARAALAIAKEKRSARAFHELRKRTKVLWYQLRLLRPLHPAVFHDLNADLRALGEHLGHAHDLCFLAEGLRGMADTTRRKKGQRAVEALIQSREKDVQRTALALAERIYAEKPKAFTKRISDHFEEWEQANSKRAKPARSKPDVRADPTPSPQKKS